MTEAKRKRRLKEITLYEVVQNDKYELPIFAGTLEEVMAFTGRTKVSILSAISHEKRRLARKNVTRTDFT